MLQMRTVLALSRIFCKLWVIDLIITDHQLTQDLQIRCQRLVS